MLASLGDETPEELEPLESIDPSRTLARVSDGSSPSNTVLQGNGLSRAWTALALEAVGIAQRALDESVAYAATATQGGAPIGTFQLVQAMIADQQTGVLAGRALVREAARMWVTGEDRRVAPSAYPTRAATSSSAS